MRPLHETVIRSLSIILTMLFPILASSTTSDKVCTTALTGQSAASSPFGVEAFLSRVYAVHATHNYPAGGVIRSGLTTGDSLVTTHFALGGLVPSHEAGSWEARPLAVLVPLPEVLSGAVNYFAQDTAYLGDFVLSKNDVILVPEDFQIPKEIGQAKIVRYRGSLRRAIEGEFSARGLLSIDMPKYSGIDGDKAWLNGVNVHSPEIFNRLHQQYPQLRRESAMETPFHGALSVLQNLCRASERQPLPPMELKLVQASALSVLALLKKELISHPFGSELNRRLSLALLNSLSRCYAELKPDLTDFRSDYMWSFGEILYLNSGLTGAAFNRRLQRAGYVDPAKLRSFLLGHHLQRYLKISTSQTEADILFEKIKSTLTSLTDLENEQSLLDFPDSGFLLRVARTELRDPAFVLRVEQLLNIPEMGRKVQHALESLDYYLTSKNPGLPVSFKKIAPLLKSDLPD